MQTLLEAGGNARRPGMTIGPLGILGSSYPLSKAAERGGNEIADLLIEAGASPTRGWTCIGGLVASGTVSWGAGATQSGHEPANLHRASSTPPLILSAPYPAS